MLTELSRSHTDLTINVVYAALRRNAVDKKLHRPLDRMAQQGWIWSSHTYAVVTAQIRAEWTTLRPSMTLSLAIR